MKVVVVGPGALGSLLAALIAGRPGHEIWVLGHNQKQVAAIGAGIVLENGTENFISPVKVTCRAEEIGPAPFIFLCVKSKDVSPALKSAIPLFADGSLLIAFQNGIGHLPVLGEYNGAVNIALGVTSQGATLVGYGHVKHAGKGPTHIGLLPGTLSTGVAEKIKQGAELLTNAGIKAEVSANIIEHVWNKLLVNVGINALTAIYDCPNGGLLENEEAKARLERAVLEAAAVARAKGIKVVAEPVRSALEVCEATRNNISSMLQDVRRHRSTEIDAINGAIVKEAEAFGIDVPENEKLVQEIKEIER